MLPGSDTAVLAVGCVGVPAGVEWHVAAAAADVVVVAGLAV